MGQQQKVDFNETKHPYLWGSITVFAAIGAIGGAPLLLFVISYAELHNINIATAIIVAILVYVIFAFIVCMIIKGISAIINSRNYYPQKTIEYNITNKRKISADTMVDNWIIQNGIEPVELHIKDIEQWKKTKIDTFKGNARKIEKFNARCALNKGKAFRFVSYRMQTRYQQVNYKKYPYQVRVNNEDVCVSEAFMLERIDFLKKHDFNITYNQYHAVDQRKVLTKSMREQVKRRDNWTCQLCGKIMRDGVGLHIDHIVPISRGGKSMLANLRVLCSKCNGSKGGRLDGDEERDDFYEKDELY